MDVNQYAILARLHVSTKGTLGERKDDGASELLVETYQAKDRKSVAAKIQLINQNAKSVRRVKATAQAMRQLLYHYGMPWGSREGQLIPLNIRPKFEKEFNRLKQNHEEAKQDYFNDYPLLVAAREKDNELGTLFRYSNYPAIDQIKNMFRCDLIYTPIPASGHFLADVTDEMKENLDRSVSNRITVACNSLVDRVEKRLVEYVDTLEGYTGGRNGRFTDTLVSNLRDVGNLIKELNFTNDPNIDRLSFEVGRIARFSADSLREADYCRDAVVSEGKTLLSRLEAYKKLDHEVDDAFSQMNEIEI